MTLYLIFKLACLKHSTTFRRCPIKITENNSDTARITDDNPGEILREVKKNNADGLMIFYVVVQFRRQIIMPSDDWTDNFLSQLGK
jgi:hypothetical protein